MDAIVVALGRWGADAPEPFGDHVGADPAIDDGRLTITGDNEAGRRLFDAVRGQA